MVKKILKVYFFIDIWKNLWDTHNYQAQAQRVCLLLSQAMAELGRAVRSTLLLGRT